MRFFGIDRDKLIFNVDDVIMTIMRNVGNLESKNTFIANSKGSSAKGKYQIIGSTFRRIIKYYNSLRFITDQKVFLTHNADNDDSVMLLLMDYYIRTIKSVYDLADINTGIIYLCHFIGAERTVKVMKHPERTIKYYLTDNEVKWNTDVFKRFKLNIEDTNGEKFINTINDLF